MLGFIICDMTDTVAEVTPGVILEAGYANASGGVRRLPFASARLAATLARPVCPRWIACSFVAAAASAAYS